MECHHFRAVFVLVVKDHQRVIGNGDVNEGGASRTVLRNTISGTVAVQVSSVGGTPRESSRRASFWACARISGTAIISQTKPFIGDPMV